MATPPGTARVAAATAGAAPALRSGAQKAFHRPKRGTLGKDGAVEPPRVEAEMIAQQPLHDAARIDGDAEVAVLFELRETRPIADDAAAADSAAHDEKHR